MTRYRLWRKKDLADQSANIRFSYVRAVRIMPEDAAGLKLEWMDG